MQDSQQQQLVGLMDQFGKVKSKFKKKCFWTVLICSHVTQILILQSVSVLEAVKRDLNEISTTVRTEVSYAGNVLNDTLKLDEPESTASTVKKSLSSFFGQVSEALAPTLEDDDAEAVLITSNGAVTLTGFQKHLAELQANEATYLSPPDSSLSENYQR